VLLQNLSEFIANNTVYIDIKIKQVNKSTTVMQNSIKSSYKLQRVRRLNNGMFQGSWQ